MKIRYYLMGAALVAMSAGFTSCSDDDDDNAPLAPESPELQLPTEVQRVKIGTDTRLPLSQVVIDGAGAYSAYSLNPDVAGVETDEDGTVYIAGYKNGMADIVLSDAANQYKRITVAVYTTDEMKLNYSNLVMTTVLNSANRVNGIAVTEGNGDYEVESDNADIEPTIDRETGALSIVATGREEPYSGTVTVSDQTGLTATLSVSVSKASHKVKIGAENRADLPVDASKGEYTAECTTPNVATIYTDGAGNKKIEGLTNGVAFVNIMQGETFYQYTFNVYTTDVMQLSHTEFRMVTPLGVTSRNTECSVLKGNGGYTVKSDNTNVYPSINASTGVITLTAASKKDAYTANVTVTDISGLTAVLKVTVEPTFDAFVQSDYDEILAISKHAIDFNGDYPYYFRYLSYGYYGKMDKTASGNLTTVGYEYVSTYWSTSYYTIQIEYPSDLAVGAEGTGNIYYCNGSSTKQPKEGTVKLLADDATKTVVCWWKVDLDAEKIDRGYVVYIK